MRFFLLFICLTFFKLDGGEIKAILLCDMKAEHIEKSVAADSKNVESALKKIASKTGLKLSLQKFSPDKMKDPFLRHINTLTINKDDIIFFYFSGHGFRTESKKENQWPNLFLTKDDKAIDFKEVFQLLKEKNPKLLIAFTDCCNNVLPEESVPSLSPINAYKGQKPVAPELSNYKRLFLNTKGSIIIAGAAPGEFSWGTTSGGLFTLAFLEAINDEVKYLRPASWRYILDRAALKIVKRDIGQTPQYEINISEN